MTSNGAIGFALNWPGKGYAMSFHCTGHWPMKVRFSGRAFLGLVTPFCGFERANLK